MRYLIATVTSLALIIMMFVFRAIMIGKIREWRDQGMSLAKIQELMVGATNMISAYWYALIPAIIIVCFTIAVVTEPRRSD